MKTLLACLLFATCLVTHGQATTDPLPDARQRVAADIAQSRQTLNDLQAHIDASRREQLATIQELRESIRQAEAELVASRETQVAQDRAAATARQQSAGFAELVDYQAKAAIEYRRAFTTTLSSAELQHYAQHLAEVDALLAEPDIADQRGAISLLLALSIDHLRLQEGGAILPGRALDANGRIMDGRFAVVGPLLYFSSDDGALAGVALPVPESPYPRVFSAFADPAAASQIRELVANSVATSVSLDPSLGSAIRLRQDRDTLIEHLYKGGITMVPLLALGVACFFLALYKLISLLLLRTHGSQPRIAEILLFLRRGKINDAYAIARQLRKPLGPVICEGIDHRDAPKEHIEEIMYERLLEQLPALERLLSPLAVCASVAPLLGLFGTVTGMIHTFRLITIFGTGDARVLSGGISEALITTQVGLCIAIPALLVHAYLSRRVRKAVAATQQSAIMFVNGLKLRLEEPETSSVAEPAHES